MSFSAVRVSISWNSKFNLFLCHLPSRPPVLPPGTSTSVARVIAKKKAVRGTLKGPTSLHSSPGQSQGNKWRAPLGGSDSETAMAWRPAVTHSTSMGELSVEAENTKALFFPSFLSFFFLFFFALPLAALRNTRAAQKHVFLIIGSNSCLGGPGSKQDREETSSMGQLQQLKGALLFPCT